MLTMQALDQTADTTRREFHKLAKLYGLPDYVKQANPDDTLNPDPRLASTAFADVRNRQFPCHTKAATWVSAVYFAEKRGSLYPKLAEWTEQRLRDFARSWGIEPDLRAIHEKHAELNREQLSDDDYMIVWATDDGRKERHYTLRNPGEVKVAADWFAANRDAYDYHDRKTMASKLLEKAAEFGVTLGDDLDELLERQAGRGTYVPAKAAQAIRDRVLAAPQGTHPEIRERLTKLADQVETNGHLATDAGTVANLCHTIDTLDRRVTKLAGHYTSRLPRPEEIFCEVLYKVARAAVDEAVQLTTGSIYRRDELARLKLSEIREVFGNDIAEACATGIQVDPEKAAEVFHTLPRNDADLLDRVLGEQGIHPMCKAATKHEGPQHHLLRQLARVDRFASV